MTIIHAWPEGQRSAQPHVFECDPDELDITMVRLRNFGYPDAKVVVPSVVPKIRPLTVRHVMEALGQLNPDDRVLMEDGSGWYVEIEAVLFPGEDTGYSLPTLTRGEMFDCRSV